MADVFLNPLRANEILTFVQSNTITVGNSTTIVFSAVPTLINKSISVSGSTDLITDKLPNLNDLGAPSQVVSATDSVSHSLSGTGSVHKADMKRWQEWRDSGTAKYVRYGVAGADGYFYEGPMILSQYEISGDMKQVVSATFTFTPTGAMAYSNTGITSANSVITA